MDNVPELHATKLDKIMVKANVELIIDNLLDLSHTSYLHAGILGNADTVEIRDRRRAGRRRHRRVALRPQRRAAGHEQADVAGRAVEGRQVHPHPLDGALDVAPRHRRLRPANARTGQRLSRRPYADAGNRPDHALFLHRGALRHFQQGRRAEPANPGEGRGDPPVRLRGPGRPGDRGAAADHRRFADQRRPADARHRRRPGALQAGAQKADRGRTGRRSRRQGHGTAHLPC